MLLGTIRTEAESELIVDMSVKLIVANFEPIAAL